MRILLVEDDLLLADGLKDVFIGIGYGLDHVTSAELAITAIRLTAFDLLIADLGLPRMDGITLIRTLRSQEFKIPILILSARDAVEERVKGLNEGADDFMLKPFDSSELLARVQALIRRSRLLTHSEISIGPLLIDLANQEARLNNTHLPLSGREWHVLQALVLAVPNAASKARIANSLSRWDREVSENAVEIYVSRLRLKLQFGGVRVRTLRGIGYRLECDEA